MSTATSQTDALTFDELKALWPAGKRGSLKVARRRWEALSGRDQEAAINGAALAQSTDTWRRGFIPHISTFLHQRRWEDLLDGADRQELTDDELEAWQWWVRRVGPESEVCRHAPRCRTWGAHKRRIVDYVKLTRG